MLHRYSLRCTSCKTCTVACPFGVIYPDIVEYRTASCDRCLTQAPGSDASCFSSPPCPALSWGDFKEDPEQNIYAVRGGRFFVRTIKWKK
jgi:Fe-S-cluster-containing dehydrogenase component